MKILKYSREGQAFTDLILAVFRLNGRLLTIGDRMTKDLNLTSARWQVLGGVIMNDETMTVAQIARKIGLTRQSVQRVVNELIRDGLVKTAINPEHRRAYLLEPTADGHRAFDKIMARQIKWANMAADDVPTAEIISAISILNRFADLVGRIELPAPKRKRRET